MKVKITTLINQHKQAKRLLACNYSRFGCNSIFCPKCATKKKNRDYQQTNYLLAEPQLYFVTLNYKTLRISELQDLKYHISKAKKALKATSTDLSKIEVNKLELSINGGLIIHFHLLTTNLELVKTIYNNWLGESKKLKVISTKGYKNNVLNYVLKAPVTFSTTLNKEKKDYLIIQLMELVKGVRFLTAKRKNIIKNKEQMNKKVMELLSNQIIQDDINTSDLSDPIKEVKRTPISQRKRFKSGLIKQLKNDKQKVKHQRELNKFIMELQALY